jgi:hypothetical protein
LDELILEASDSVHMSKFSLVTMLTRSLAYGAILVILTACDGSSGSGGIGAASGQTETSTLSALHISGDPSATVIAGALYNFQPFVETNTNRGVPHVSRDASADSSKGLSGFQQSSDDSSAGVLSFGIQNKPTWAAFNTSTGLLSGTPTRDNVGTYSNIVISATANATSSDLAPFAISVTNDEAVPIPAQQVGFLKQTYGANPVLASDSPGVSNSAVLYPWNFLGETTPTSDVTANSDSSITIVGNGIYNSQIASAAATKSDQKYQGVAFGGGGYFEAVLKFDGWQGQTTSPDALVHGWPAFWSLALEHLLQDGSSHWSGQIVGYEHFIEMDFFEYNLANSEQTSDIYSGSIVDWYGVWNKTCPTPLDRFCAVENPYPNKIRLLPSGTDFSTFHSYGALWVPATDTSDGYLEWFFDGTSVGKSTTWPKLVDPPEMSSPGKFAFGIADLQHLVLILGTGSDCPMTIRSLSVWQKTADNNMIN